MNRNPVRGSRKPSALDVNKVWVGPTLDDVTGIDDDIERLIGLLQEKHGYTRDMASAELVRKLSFAA